MVEKGLEDPDPGNQGIIADHPDLDPHVATGGHLEIGIERVALNEAPDHPKEVDHPNHPHQETKRGMIRIENVGHPDPETDLIRKKITNHLEMIAIRVVGIHTKEIITRDHRMVVRIGIMSTMSQRLNGRDLTTMFTVISMTH